MELRLLGHAAASLTSDEGETLLIDPYESGGFGGAMAYDPIRARADWVACTHAHLDHCATHTLPGSPTLIEGEGRFGAFDVRRHEVAHDEYDGRRRGGMVDILQVTAGEHTLVHLSDVGQSPTPALVDALHEPDLLLVPVGGFFTMGAAQAWEWSVRLNPRWIIPCHYRTSACHLPIRGVEVFEAYFEDASHGARRLDAEAFRVHNQREPGLWVLPMTHISAHAKAPS